VNPDERIVEVVVSRRRRRRKHYGIRDEYLGYWRSVLHISDDRAWTRDQTLRALFPSREAAGQELKSIWDYRRQRACA
jgi:hypothetical protein